MNEGVEAEVDAPDGRSLGCMGPMDEACVFMSVLYDDPGGSPSFE